MTTTQVPTEIVEALIIELVDVNDRIARLAERGQALRGQLALALPVGKHTAAGVAFSIKAPSRRFDVEAAFASLPDYVQPLCMGPVAAKVKAQIAPVDLDAFYSPGTGDPVVVLS